MLEHAGRGGIVEATPRVLQLQKQTIATVSGDGNRIVRLSVVIVEVSGGGPITRSLHLPVERLMLVDQQRIEERRSARHFAP